MWGRAHVTITLVCSDQLFCLTLQHCNLKSSEMDYSLKSVPALKELPCSWHRISHAQRCRQLECLSGSSVIEDQNHAKFQQNYFKRFFLSFLNALVCVLASQKKLPKFSLGKGPKTNLQKLIYKMAVMTECESYNQCILSFQHAIIKLLVFTLLCFV